MYYIYYLLDAVTKELLYIGRSHRPKVRQNAFGRRTGKETHLGFCQRFQCFAKAQQAELEAITKHKPPFNKYIASSAGTRGQRHKAEVKAKISAAKMGHITSEETRGKLRHLVGPNTGRVFTQEHKQKISQSLTGKHLSQETRQKLAQASRAAWARRKQHASTMLNNQ